MGLEFINQPQVFTQPITALGGILGGSENYPLLQKYYTWTVIPTTDVTSINIDGGAAPVINKSESFIINVGGVVQPPSTYTVNTLAGTIDFTTPLSANIPVIVSQLATASPSSQSFSFLRSLTATINTLSCLSANIGFLTVNSSFEPPNLYLPAPGELGIGVDSAGTLTKFHIRAAENDQVTITNNTLGSSWRFNVSDSNASLYFFDFENNRVPVRILKDTPTNTLYLTPTGVGINTIIPNQALTVSGNISATNTITCTAVRTVNLTGTNAIFTGNSFGFGTASPSTTFEFRGGIATFTCNGDIKSVAARYNQNSNPVYFGASSESSTPDAVISNAGGTILTTFTNNGNVGIGTTTPNARLTVGATLGGSALGTTLITNAGGLGATAGNSLSLANFGFTSANVTSLGIKARRLSNDNGWTTSAIGLTFDVDNTSPVNNSQIWMTAAGNVGIGTVTPNTKLTVSGDLSASGLISSPFVDSYLALGNPGIELYKSAFTSNAYGDLSALSTNLAVQLEANSTYDIEYSVYYLGKWYGTDNDISIVFMLSSDQNFVPNTYYYTARNDYYEAAALTTTTNVVISGTTNTPFLTSLTVASFDPISPTGRNGLFVLNGIFTTSNAMNINLGAKVKYDGAAATNRGASIQALKGSYRKIKKLPTTS